MKTDKMIRTNYTNAIKTYEVLRYVFFIKISTEISKYKQNLLNYLELSDRNFKFKK